MIIRRGHLDRRAVDLMIGSRVTIGAGEVQALGGHVHVEGGRRIDLIGVQLAVFDTGASSTVEVTRSTGLSARGSDVESDVAEVERLPDLPAPRRELSGLRDRVAGAGWELLVGTGRVVADEAVDVLFGREIEGVIGPSVSRVATRAARFIRLDADAEVVDLGLLSDDIRLAERSGIRLPRPVGRRHDLFRRFGVARQTGLGHVLVGGELLVEDLELGVVGGRVRVGPGVGRCTGRSSPPASPDAVT